MKDGDPTNNRIDDVRNHAPIELSPAILKELLIEHGVTFGIREFLELLGIAFFRAPIAHTVTTFRAFVYKFIDIQKDKLHDSLLRDTPEAKESYEDYIRRKCMEIAMEALGDVDFETIVYLATILQKNDWGDFERVFSQRNPVPHNPSTIQTPNMATTELEDSQTDKTEELPVIIVNTDTSSGEAANIHERVPEKNDWLVTSSLLEKIFRSQGITPSRQLLILTVLFECQQESMKMDVSINKLNTAVYEKIAEICREMNKQMSDLKLKGIDMDRNILKSIIKKVFLKHLPTKYINDDTYRMLVQLILTGALDIETTFTKIREYLIKADYMEDIHQASTEVLFPKLRGRDEH